MTVLHFLATGFFQFTVATSGGMSQSMFSIVLTEVLTALLKHVGSYIQFPKREELATVKGDFFGLGQIPNVIGSIDGTHRLGMTSRL